MSTSKQWVQVYKKHQWYYGAKGNLLKLRQHDGKVKTTRLSFISATGEMFTGEFVLQDDILK